MWLYILFISFDFLDGFALSSKESSATKKPSKFVDETLRLSSNPFIDLTNKDVVKQNEIMSVLKNPYGLNNKLVLPQRVRYYNYVKNRRGSAIQLLKDLVIGNKSLDVTPTRSCDDCIPLRQSNDANLNANFKYVMESMTDSLRIIIQNLEDIKNMLSSKGEYLVVKSPAVSEDFNVENIRHDPDKQYLRDKRALRQLENHSDKSVRTNLPSDNIEVRGTSEDNSAPMTTEYEKIYNEESSVDSNITRRGYANLTDDQFDMLLSIEKMHRDIINQLKIVDEIKKIYDGNKWFKIGYVTKSLGSFKCSLNELDEMLVDHEYVWTQKQLETMATKMHKTSNTVNKLATFLKNHAL